MSDSAFQRYSAYYDLLYRDKDYDAESAYIGGLLRLAPQPVSRVLEFGSGTGKHGRRLAEQGFQVHGIEQSPGMVAAAQKLAGPAAGGGRFECVTGDIRTARGEGTFDAVIALFHVISYLNRNDDVAQCFANAARHLAPGGHFIFDVWHGPAVLTERPSVRVKRVEDAQTRLMRLAEPELDTNQSVVTVRYTIFAEPKSGGERVTFGEEHRMRYFLPAEIELFAAQAGFDLVRSEEFQTGRAPSAATWGVAYVLRKRD